MYTLALALATSRVGEVGGALEYRGAKVFRPRGLEWGGDKGWNQRGQRSLSYSPSTGWHVLFNAYPRFIGIDDRNFVRNASVRLHAHVYELLIA